MLAFLQFVKDWIPPCYTSLPPLRDPSLSYPADQETCSDSLLVVLSLVIPLICILIFSFFFEKLALGVNVLALLQSYSNALLLMNVFKKVTGLAHIVTSGCVLHASHSGRICDCAGKPRPCFYDMCKWDWEKGECTAAKHLTWKAFQSFPSGHALLSFAGLSLSHLSTLKLLTVRRTCKLVFCRFRAVT